MVKTTKQPRAKAKRSRLGVPARTFQFNSDSHQRWFQNAIHEIKAMLGEAKDPKHKPLHLLMWRHWLFFDKNVQKVLMEASPELHGEQTASPTVKPATELDRGLIADYVRIHPWYPIHAYLLAEQLVYFSYVNITMPRRETVAAIGEMAVYCFTAQLNWCSRLQVAMTKAVQKICWHGNDAHAFQRDWEKIQLWKLEERITTTIFNGKKTITYNGMVKSPKMWLEGSEQRKIIDGKDTKKNRSTALRRAAKLENEDRIIIFQTWREAWVEELQFLKTGVTQKTKKR